MLQEEIKLEGKSDINLDVFTPHIEILANGIKDLNQNVQDETKKYEAIASVGDALLENSRMISWMKGQLAKLLENPHYLVLPGDRFNYQYSRDFDHRKYHDSMKLMS